MEELVNPYEYLQENKYKILDKFEGKWIVVGNRKEVYAFSSQKEAHNFIHNNYEEGRWTSKLCTYEEITKVYYL